MAPHTFEEIMQAKFRPQDDEDWQMLGILANHTFTPKTAIRESDLFAGRLPEVSKLIRVIYQSGAHAILFGERGVGKSSLANIISQRVIDPAGTKVLKINCSPKDTFETVWSNVFFGFTWQDRPVREIIAENPQPFTVYKIAESLAGSSNWHLIILDEFDRIEDPTTKMLIADTIKYLSDNPVKVTIVVVGVGSSVEILFGNHPSIRRCCAEIRMPRMSPQELELIISSHLPKVHMTANGEAVKRMIQLSQGFPGYMHLMGMLSAQVALECHQLHIEVEHVTTAVPRALDIADESTRKDYHCAIRSTKPDNRYRQVLLACARAKKNELGQFAALDVCRPYSEIMGKMMGIEHFARHLNAFCNADRGPALLKSGKPKSFMYQFANPMLEPLVIMISDSGFQPND